ncbi:Multifunctional conjugation protein TraI [Stieleria neptunia]|uniref:Multifunctional conjugation protein TraI n=1 Tax=Stieleria neptunia TaxID=2527979 RepID=A0A518HNU0_9BACT|nr:MobF family relaxase [Stieleria neptunia]QDV42513.1 Multifunctional conjugation protein TraI [Stieleria neptunia]
MLIATQSKNVAATRQYFDQVLTQGDYYLGQEVNGQWHGKGADTLGLGCGTDVTKQQFASLLQGEHPVTGKSLTQRNRKDRRPGMDLTFSVPKSVSLAWAINGDERIVAALRETVQETMAKDVEPLMQRRVRHGEHHNSEQKSTTGELIYADFLHKTSRPVNGKADPHLHIHAFVINWTQQNGRHYAGQFEEIVRQRPSLQAKFESRLARRLRDQLGYAVTPTRFAQSGRIKAGWELAGLERATIEKFSQRMQQVEQTAATRGIRDAAKKAELGKRTREKKDDGASVEELRREWCSRLTEQERDGFAVLGRGTAGGDDRELPDIGASIQYALDHHLYRNSAVERHQIVGTALEHGLTFSPEQMEAALDRCPILQRTIDRDGASRCFITTQEVLNAEKRMIDFARDGRGTRTAIAETEHVFQRNWLDVQQKAAVDHVLQSRDSVLAITGGAGTGKSSLMQEAAEAIAKNNKTVFTFAPSTGAKEVLHEKGFARTETVEHLIRNTKLHPELKDQVVWIDEAGLVDVRSMNAVFDIAKEQNCRVVLSGDTRQHASPRRGEAMRLLEQEAGLSIARVEAIQRQKGKYRQAVETISRGHEIDPATGKSGLLAGFDMLDRMGKIIEIDAEKKHEVLATSYLSAMDRGKSTLVVAPTHAEGDAATEQIRESLKDRGKLSSEERVFTQLKPMNLTEAEKRETSTYQDQKGAIVQFHQNAKDGIKRGERYRVAGAAGNEVEVVSLTNGKRKTLPLSTPDRFEVYREAKVAIAAGDRVRFSLSGTTKNGKSRISNGRLDDVKGFDAKGNLILKGGHVIDKDFGHLDLGYVITSHASQGKDRDVVFASMGAASLPVINAKTLYVTASRGSQDVVLYVDDKARVRRAIERSGEQMSATELMKTPAPKVDKSPAPQRTRTAERTRGRWSSFGSRLSRWWNLRTSRQPSRHSGRTPSPERRPITNTPKRPFPQPRRSI